MQTFTPAPVVLKDGSRIPLRRGLIIQPPILMVNGTTTIYQKFYKPLHPNPNDPLDRVLPIRFYAVRVDELNRMAVRTPWKPGKLYRRLSWWQKIWKHLRVSCSLSKGE